MNRTNLKTNVKNNTKVYRRRIALSTTAIFMSSAVLSGLQNPTLALTPKATQQKLDTADELLLAEAENLTDANKVQVTVPSFTGQVRKTVLKNGLTVLTKEVHTAPIVSVQVWYKVGSLDEPRGQKGIAHLLEHMLFRGTKERPIQFGQLLTALGSDFAAFIDYEYTYYLHTIAPHKLKALLTLEADRMQNTLITAEDLAQEKQILFTELQSRQSNPYYKLYNALLDAQFPHRPYSQTVTQADLEKITVEQVQDFYQHYYRANNTNLVIVGDFQTEDLLQDIQAIFGTTTHKEQIRSIQEAESKRVPSFVSSTSRLPIVLSEAVGLPAVAFIYPLPEREHPDIPALIVMDYILNYGVSSYLPRALESSGLANSKIAKATFLSRQGWYLIGATAKSESNLNRVEWVIEQVITHLQTQGVSLQELNRAKAQIRGNTILGNRTLANQAYRIGYDQTVLGDYNYIERFLEAVNRVRAEDIQRVAKKYFTSQKLIVGRLEPTQPTDAVGDIQTIDWNLVEDFSPTNPFSAAEVTKYLPPLPAVNSQQPVIPVPQYFTLPNGLQVLLLSDSTTPSVSLRGYIRAGHEFDPPDKAGLAALTTSNLLSGPFWLLQELESRGSTGINFECDIDGLNIYALTLAGDLPLLLETLADILQYASFPSQSLEISRQNYLTAVQAAAEAPTSIARQALVQAVYPENHPFHQVPSEVTLKAISREDVVDFYQQHYRPDTTVLTLVGDFNSSQVRTHLEAIFGNWRAKGKPPLAQWSEGSIPQRMVRLNKPLSNQTQSLTLIGHPLLELRGEYFYATKVLNEILGGNSISSRLANELRHNQSLTYTIGSQLESRFQSNLFYIFMKTAPENSTLAISSTLAILKQVQEEGVSDAEVEIAKQTLIRNYQMALANPDSLASIILFNHLYGYNPEEVHLVIEQIQAITTQQVNQVAKKLLHPDQFVIVTVEGDS